MYTLVILITIQTALSETILDKNSLLIHDNEPESELVDLLMSKGYIPDETKLPKPSSLQRTNDDNTYLLSKLSDEDLIKLLTKQSSQKEYHNYDIFIAANENSDKPLVEQPLYQQNNNDLKNLITAIDKNGNNAYYKLENKEIDPQYQKNNPDYVAWKKLNSLLNVPLQQDLEERSIDDEKKELLFDILVAQLKALCCKKKTKRQELLSNKYLYKMILNQYLPKFLKQNSLLSHLKSARQKSQKTGEFLFLIINDDVKSKSSDEIILVDPESLEKNSSVLLLGPITTPLSDEQLKIVVNRISNELSKSEYSSLLEQLSKGTLSGDNRGIMNKFIFGPETRRYIKPHRCNHQSKLARIHGGPKWLICTGYINLNVPSLYD